MTLDVSRHAAERLAERITDPQERAAILDRTERAADQYPGRRLGARVARLDDARQTGTDRYGDRASNGDEVWAIVDTSTRFVVTFMYRRSNQPRDRRRFEVDQLVIVD